MTRGKPDPEIYRKAAERFGVPAGSVLVLEDSPPGLAAAKAAGAFAVGVPHEHSPADGPRRGRPDRPPARRPRPARLDVDGSESQGRRLIDAAR